MRQSHVSHEAVLTGPSLRQAVREVVRKHLDLGRYQLFIFGSQASGTAGRRSDIDVGILGPQSVPGFVMQRIREELETLRTLRSFDIVDFAAVDESFKAEALEHAEPL